MCAILYIAKLSKPFGERPPLNWCMCLLFFNKIKMLTTIFAAKHISVFVERLQSEIKQLPKVLTYKPDSSLLN